MEINRTIRLKLLFEIIDDFHKPQKENVSTYY